MTICNLYLSQGRMLQLCTILVQRRMDDVVALWLCPECPTMAMWAINGTNCTAANSSVYLTEPATVTFKCLYDNPDSTTNYMWSMDGTPHPSTGNDAHFAITSGQHHRVTCKANIHESADCQCDEERSIQVTVVGTYQI